MFLFAPCNESNIFRIVRLTINFKHLIYYQLSFITSITGSAVTVSLTETKSVM
jgi:hypothetical protein